MTIALNGASGLVGTHIREYFDDCVILNRDDTHEDIVHKLKNVDVVINLTGAPIIKRWTNAYKKTLYDSRIDTTKELVKAVNASDVKLFISTSAVGIYPNDSVCDESCSSYGEDFLAHLTQAWEDEAQKCEKPTAIFRFGVILSDKGGALKQMALPFRFGIGGAIGDGSMMMSWMHIKDLMRMYEFVITRQLTGVFNAVAPLAVSNKTFSLSLAKALHTKSRFNVPTFMLKLLYGQAAQVLTDSKHIKPTKLVSLGFNFEYPEVNKALKSLV